MSQRTTPLPPFERVALITNSDLLGARWWHEGMAAVTVGSPLRRRVLKHLLGTGGLIALTTVGAVGTVVAFQSCEDDETVGALDLQRAEGWDVGSTNHIEIPNAMSSDSAGSDNWAQTLASLGDDLAPSDQRLMPLHVPTLFDVLRDGRSQTLSRTLKPMHSWDMAHAQAAAEGLADVFDGPAECAITALVLDLPGPESVAAAVGLAREFTPVFLFDNWPHPLGVVPSHLAMAAAIYHRPDFLAAERKRRPSAPPVFVLDSQRLLPYSDASDRFDNRYFSRLPTAATLQKLGIQRVLYVTALKGGEEQDDLNADFVDYDKANIDVKTISLYEFETITEPEPRSSGSSGGGSSGGRCCRYHGYSSARARSAFYSSYYPNSSARSTHLDPALDFTEPPERRSLGAKYTPKPRNTLFRLGALSGDSVHFQKTTPEHFARPLAGSNRGVFNGRSGSLGRLGSHSFG